MIYINRVGGGFIYIYLCLVLHPLRGSISSYDPSVSKHVGVRRNKCQQILCAYVG